MAIILCGMVGVTYAITANDADQYVTRSQYAVDMAHLQNKLDEKEAGLLGEINRYRSTNIKFTTFDTPNTQLVSSKNQGYHGYHRGGNMYPRTMAASGTWQGNWGLRSDTDSEYVYGYHNNISMYRLWNGNYYITTNITYRSNYDSSVTSNVQTYYPMVRCAVPVENYPGWYLVMGTFRTYSSRLEWYVSLVKLDPTVPMPSNAEIDDMLNNGVLQIRFKKELWDYGNEFVKKYTTSPYTTISSCDYYTNPHYGYLNSTYKSEISRTGTRNITCTSWIDAETGDFMMTLKNMVPLAVRAIGSTVYAYTFRFYTDFMLSSLLPKDNVEHFMAPVNYVSSEEAGSHSNYVASFPDARYIGTGQGNDSAYDIEIVDGVNGIKYWHCYKRPSTTKIGSYYPSILGMHYSLPIVY